MTDFKTIDGLKVYKYEKDAKLHWQPFNSILAVKPKPAVAPEPGVACGSVPGNPTIILYGNDSGGCTHGYEYAPIGS